MQVAFDATGQDKVQNALRQTDAGIDDLAGKSTRSAGRIGSAFAGAGQAIALGFGVVAAAGVAKFGTGMISSASDWSESISKSNVIFGQSSAAVQDWAKGGAESMGINQQAALETAATFGNLFSGMGVGQEAAADMSKGIVGLGADLSSFNNIPMDQVLQDIQSGLVGEAEPLRKYGILLDEATVSQKAMQMSGKKTAKMLTQQDKLLARQALIFEQTTAAQGDYARTSKGLANQMRTLKAEVTNLGIGIGTKLLPVTLDAVDATNRFLDRFNDKRAQGFSVWDSALKSLHTTLNQTLGRTAGNLIIGTIRGIGDAFGAIVGAAGAAINVVQGLGSALAAGDYGSFFAQLGTIGLGLVSALGDISADIGDWALRQFQAVNWSGVWSGVQDVGRGLLTGLGSIATDIAAWVRTQFSGINWMGVAADLHAQWMGALNSVDWSNLGESFGGLVRSFAIKAAELIAGFATAIKDNWQTIGTVIAGLVLAIPAALGYLGLTLAPKALELIQGFVKGLDINWPLITGWLSGLAAKLASAINDALGGIKETASSVLEERLIAPLIRWALSLVAKVEAVADFGFITDALNGIGEAITSATAAVLPEWLTGLPGQIESIIGKLEAAWALVVEWKNKISAEGSSGNGSTTADGGAGNGGNMGGSTGGFGGGGQPHLEPFGLTGLYGGGGATGAPAAPPPIVVPPPDLTAFNAAWATVPLTIGTAMSAALASASTYATAIYTVVSAQFGQLVGNATAILSMLSTNVSTQFTTMATNATTAATAIYTGVSASFGMLVGNATALVTALAASVGAAFGAMSGNVQAITGAMAGSVVGILNGLAGSGAAAAYNAGVSIGAGLANGLAAMIGQVQANAAALANAAAAAVVQAARISSPSKVFAEFGEYMGEGLALGMASTTGDVARAGGRLMESAIPNDAWVYRRPRGRAEQSGGITYVINGDLLGQKDWEKRVRELTEAGAATVVDRRLVSARQAGR